MGVFIAWRGVKKLLEVIFFYFAPNQKSKQGKPGHRSLVTNKGRARQTNKMYAYPTRRWTAGTVERKFASNITEKLLITDVLKTNEKAAESV